MVELNRTYRHPRNGAEVVIRRNDPEGYEFRATVPAKMGRARAHVHLDFEQDFHVDEGVARFSIDGEERELRAGETVHLPRGTRHVDPWNPGPARLVLRNVIAPNPPFIRAYGETILAMLVDGRLGDAGELSPLHTAVVLHATDGQSYAAGPIALQRALRPLLAAIGRRRGYRLEQPA
jgi:mannose-6-phosphate isomerase-like protein (cupin superfamily)